MNKENIEKANVTESPLETRETERSAERTVENRSESPRGVFNRDRNALPQNKNRRFSPSGGPNSGAPQRRPMGFNQGMGPRNPKDDFISETLEVRRVAKTTTGGKKLSFSALVAIGNKDGTIGIGKGKDTEVSGAINKALNHAHKNLIRISRFRNTIIHDVHGNFKATKILLKKARKGTGCISCNVVKSIMRLAGVEDLVAKVIGSSNLNNVVKALLNGVDKLESPKSVAIRRGKTLEELLSTLGVKQRQMGEATPRKTVEATPKRIKKQER